MHKTCKKLLVCTNCAFLLLILIANLAFADSKHEAEKALQQAVDEISQTLNTANLDNVSEDSEVIAKLEKKILAIFSMDQFSMRTVGRKWQKFSPEQKTSFKAAFVTLLKATYFTHVSEYNGEKLTILGSRTNRKGNKVEVRTVVNYKEKQVPVNYRMLTENNNWMIYDVLVEGVSLVKNYRTQFSELLRHGTPDELIKKIQDKAERVRQQRAVADKK
ncbi:MlaC/ttg2D family ABC transporter substrate-binding protein [Halodesulfovibrio spirochaetisodalis]|uniref:MlaC/ttg2D family ABC transporter substrate-binding protein n=1 Tax=Halodesulfovibrio spirochaetisodalis TaxID=1560234 RepID=UPI00082D19FA|nr:ABC transporter substrate-binding protein [Halodesulfovibrio spirochaetisodalis]